MNQTNGLLLSRYEITFLLNFIDISCIVCGTASIMQHICIIESCMYAHDGFFYITCAHSNVCSLKQENLVFTDWFVLRVLCLSIDAECFSTTGVGKPHLSTLGSWTWLCLLQRHRQICSWRPPKGYIKGTIHLPHMFVSLVDLNICQLRQVCYNGQFYLRTWHFS